MFSFLTKMFKKKEAPKQNSFAGMRDQNYDTWYNVMTDTIVHRQNGVSIRPNSSADSYGDGIVGRSRRISSGMPSPSLGIYDASSSCDSGGSSCDS